MGKTLVLSVLVLALGIAWSAADSPASVEQLRQLEEQILGPAANPTPAASCTVQCPPELYHPYAPPSCTSTTGNCSSGNAKGLYWISCDGQAYICSYL